MTLGVALLHRKTGLPSVTRGQQLLAEDQRRVPTPGTHHLGAIPLVNVCTWRVSGLGVEIPMAR